MSVNKKPQKNFTSGRPSHFSNISRNCEYIESLMFELDLGRIRLYQRSKVTKDTHALDMITLHVECWQNISRRNSNISSVTNANYKKWTRRFGASDLVFNGAGEAVDVQLSLQCWWW